MAVIIELKETSWLSFQGKVSGDVRLNNELSGATKMAKCAIKRE